MDYQKEILRNMLRKRQSNRGFEELPIVDFEEKLRIDGKNIKPKSIEERLLRAVFTREYSIQGHPQWTDSWTVNSTYTNVEGSFIEITFSDFPDHEFYFEMIGKTDAGTGYWRLYNNTDSVAITESEITSTSTSFERIRSSAITKPSGTKEFIIQHKIVGGDGATEYVNSGMSRIILRLP